MQVTVRIVVLFMIVTILTIFVGWWTVPLVGAVWGIVAARETAPVMTAAAASGLAWAALLGWAAMRGPIVELSQAVAPILSLPNWGLMGVTVLFPMLLAGSAAMLTNAAKQKRK